MIKVNIRTGLKIQTCLDIISLISPDTFKSVFQLLS